MAPPTPQPPPYKIAFLPPPGPAVLSLPPPGPAILSPTPPSPSIPQTFHDALAVRYQVFIVGQNCPAELEIDPDDPIAWHWVLYPSSADDSTPPIPAGTIRLAPAAQTPNPAADSYDTNGLIGHPDYEHSKIWDGKEPFLLLGRLATREEFRGQGYGRALVEEAVGWAGTHADEEVVRDWRDEKGERVVWKGLVLAHAQVDMEGWYRRGGWRTDEGLGTWDEVGIRHVGMWRRVEV